MSFRTVALTTMHGKLAQIAPAFERLDDWKLELVDDLDTDVFGTFTGDVPRSASPTDTAIAKALAGAQHGGFEFGLASEGTIGPHPAFPFATSDAEVIALVSRNGDLTLCESHVSTSIQAHRQVFTAADDVAKTVRLLDLPRHAATVVVESNGEQRVYKGIHEPALLEQILTDECRDDAHHVVVENDYRAMHSPTRQQNISACAEKLVDRLASRCPGCNEVGWGKVDIEFGLPCSLCGATATTVARAHVFGCLRCETTQRVAVKERTADPSRCDVCNP